MIFQPVRETRQTPLPFDQRSFALSQIDLFLGAEARREGVVEDSKDFQALCDRHFAEQPSLLGFDFVPTVANLAQVSHEGIIPGIVD